MTEYKTGFDEFMVTRLLIKSMDASIPWKSNSFAVLLVISGSGHVHFGDQFGVFDAQALQAYFVLPG